MAVTVKAYFTQPGASEPEIRRFTLDQDVSSKYMYLTEKILKVYPYLNGKSLRTFWKDEDGDDIRFSSDEELIDALGLSKAIFKVYIKVDEPSCTASSEPMVHPGVVCDGCQGPVIGLRYKCQVCPDFDLCSTCKGKGQHPEHEMTCMDKPRGSFPFMHGGPPTKIYCRKGTGMAVPPPWVQDMLLRKRQAWEKKNADQSKKEKEDGQNESQQMEDCPFGAPFGGPYRGMGQPPWMMRKCMRKMWAKQQRGAGEKGEEGLPQFQPWMMRKGWRKWWKNQKGENSDDEEDISEKLWMKRCQQQWYQKQQKWSAKNAATGEDASEKASQPENIADQPKKFYPFMLKKNLRKWWKDQQAEKVPTSESDEAGGSDEEKDKLAGLPDDVKPWMMMKCWKKWWKYNMGMSGEYAEEEQPEGNINEPADAQYLKSVGESVAAMLDPLGIDVAVHIETKERKVPTKESNTEPPTSEAGESQMSVDAVDGAASNAPQDERASPEAEEWTMVGTPAAGVPQTEAIPKTDDDAKLDEAMPVEAQLNPKVAKSLAQMKAMGFTDDGGWLTQLLESKDGDIGRVLDVIQPRPV